LANLVILAAAIPFALIVIAVAVMATVKYYITDTHVQVSILGFVIRKIPVSGIRSVEYIPPEPGKGWTLLHQSGVVVIGIAGGRSLAMSPSDAEGFAEDLKDRLSGRTGGRL